jgi:hypothetical protein
MIKALPTFNGMVMLLRAAISGHFCTGSQIKKNNTEKREWKA